MNTNECFLLCPTKKDPKSLVAVKVLKTRAPLSNKAEIPWVLKTTEQRENSK